MWYVFEQILPKILGCRKIIYQFFLTSTLPYRYLKGNTYGQIAIEYRSIHEVSKLKAIAQKSGYKLIRHGVKFKIYN